jgi:chromosome segregation protein
MQPKLKSLELHGYKTFAIRTGFEFPGMITAIVGPNGSGKSNIADALRWVLGEQSYSLLRGKKTEDMIFAGSEQRPRAGMASATIVFDNTDGWLPIDYTEVSITRRAYRDGQNEYLLNGQRVRLREISELLAQSGLAERTYTIIGQGLVDAALALKPEERRRLFEEAAGIGLYRSRKEEAVTRLTATQRNLERVQDILAELEPRLQSLEKQARRAQEYERIKTDLRLLLRDWYGYHWHHAQQESKRVQEIVRQQEIRRDKARERQDETSRSLAQARGAIQNLRNQLNAWHAQSAQLHTDLERSRRDLAILEERERSILGQRQAVSIDLVHHEEEQETLLQTLQLAIDEKDRLLAEVLEAEAQATAFRQKLQTRQSERNRVEIQLRDARQQLRGLETRQVQVKAHQDELAARLETQEKTLEGVQQALETAQKESLRAKQGLKDAGDERLSAEAERRKAEENLMALRHQIQLDEAQRKRQLDDRSRLDAERVKMKTQLDVLVQAEASFSGFAEGAKALLQAVRLGRLKGAYNPLGNRIEVPLELEIAVSVALGEYLDLVLLDPTADPESTLSFLEKGEARSGVQGSGRVVFLPNGWGTAIPGVPIPNDPDCLGRASDMVNCEESLRPVVELLLSQVLVVRNRTAAKRLLQELPATAKVVTLTGEVFLASGPVIAGQAGRSGLISRPRQKRELHTSIEEIEAALISIRQSLEVADNKITDLRTQEGDLQRNSRQAALRLEKVQEKYQQASLAVEQARRQQEWQVNQRGSLQGLIQNARKEMEQGNSELSLFGEKAKEAQALVQKLQTSLTSLPMEEFQSQAVHWNTALAVATRGAKDAEKRVNDRQQVLDRNKAQQASLQARREGLTVDIEKLTDEKNKFRQLEDRVGGQIETLEVQIRPAEIQLNDAEKGYEGLQSVEDAAQQALTIAERFATQAQADLGRQRDGIENLRRRIEEDFGLVAFEYAPTVSGPTPLPFEGLVEELPGLVDLPTGLEESIARQRSQLRRMGAINPDALNEYTSVKERYQFMTSQVADLRKADADLRQVINDLEELMKRDFRKTFNAVAGQFKIMFSRLFPGGTARLVLVDDGNIDETGIDIEARLPGRREQGLSLLSGGERSLTAGALVFALLKVAPTPFCVMDEVDAMLDESNVGRFCELLTELSQTTQFLVITHNRNTVQAAKVIYGITLGRDSVSQMISLKFDEISEEMIR